MDYVLLLAGFILLIKGADYFVEGSASVAAKLRVPPIIIGLTVVAMGTSAPECAVSIAASFKGDNAVAISNVIGSNIFNILFVLGIAAAISPIAFIRENMVDIIVLVAMSLLVWGFAWTKQKLVRWEGVCMLLIYAGYLGYIINR